MPLYTVYIKDSDTEAFAIEADFLPREGDILWVSTAHYKNRFKKQLKVIRIEHSIFAIEKDSILKPNYNPETGKFDYVKVSYNVITVEVEGIAESEKIEEKNMAGIIKPEVEEN